MVTYHLKDGTKDIDIVMEDEKQFKSIVKYLGKVGYRVVDKTNLTQTYKLISAQAIMENNDGFRWDIFLRVVANKLFLSPQMKERAKEYATEG